MQYSRKDFGEDFIWGVSTAAYQTEGAYNTDGKGLSIWDVFSKKRKKIYKGQNADVACDFYNRYTKDIALLHSLRIPNFRFSLSWSRIMPDGKGKVNEKGIEYYHRVIDLCLELGITPWITLYHWDLPLTLEHEGGWTNRDIVGRMADYTALCIQTFGDKVKHWMILNEPMVFTGAGYFLGIHAPGKKGMKNFLPAVHHAVLAQSVGIHTAKALRNDLQVGTTFSCSAVHPHSPDLRDVKAAYKADALLNRLFAEPLCGKGYPVDTIPFLRRLESYMKADDEKRMQADPDFIGIQNYTREIAKHSFFTPYLRTAIVPAHRRTTNITEMNWEVYPSALYEMLQQFGNYGFKKIIVTENGAAFEDVIDEGKIEDTRRLNYLHDHIQQVLRAKKAGVPVEGYFAWSLTDNFEWAEGYRPRFGLIYVDYHTQKRIIKSSGYWYKGFLENMPTSSIDIKPVVFNQDNTASNTFSTH